MNINLFNPYTYSVGYVLLYCSYFIDKEERHREVESFCPWFYNQKELDAEFEGRIYTQANSQSQSF